MLVKRQCADILITIPFTDMEAAEQMLGLVNRALPQGSSSRPSLSQFRHIVSAVLEGSYVSLLTNRACKIELTPEQQRVFVLQPPGVMYWYVSSIHGLQYFTACTLLHTAAFACGTDYRADVACCVPAAESRMLNPLDSITWTRRHTSFAGVQSTRMR